MTKLTILSRDFFVDAAETRTRQAILALCDTFTHIKYMGEHTVSRSLQFLYERDSGLMNQFVEVSVLPLTVDESRVSLTVTPANPEASYSARHFQNTLTNFEGAVVASLNGELSSFICEEEEVRGPWKMFQFMMMLVASLGVFFLWRKLS